MIFFVPAILLILLTFIALYLVNSRSYSNSYIVAAIARQNRNLTTLNVMGLLIFDRSIIALLIYRLSHRIGNRFIGRLLTNFAFFFTGIEIYFNAKIGFRVQLWHGQGTVIGQNAVIGDDCLILHQVTLGSGFVVLGNRVKVGAGAKVLGSISISDDCVIGANAVVTRSLPSHTLITLALQETTIPAGRETTFGTKC